MKLFGYDEKKLIYIKKFFYENNSMWGKNGEDLTMG